MPGYDAASWAMLIAPAKTPKPILTRLNAEVNAIVNTAEVKQQLVNLGINPIGRGSLDELQAFVKAEVARWARSCRRPASRGRSRAHVTISRRLRRRYWRPPHG